MQRFCKVLALSMCILMALTACTIDPERQNEIPVIKVNGQEISYAVVNSIYQSNLDQYAYQYQVDLTKTDSETKKLVEEIRQSVIDYLVEGLVQQDKAKELGVYDLTDEQRAEAEAAAQADIEAEIEYLIGAYDIVDSEFGTAHDIALGYLTDNGYTAEYLTELNMQDMWMENLKAKATEDVTATEDEIRAAYDQKLAEDRQLYTTTPLQYATDFSKGLAPCYRPENFKQIKHILISTDYDKEMEIYEVEDELATEQEKESPDAAVVEELTARIEELRAAMMEEILPEAEAALERVHAGEDFDALIAELGEDPGMMFEPEKTTGYLVRPDSNYVEQFLQAVNELTEIGQVSGLVATNYGYHIIKYVGDVAPGAVPYEEVRDSVESQYLSTKRNERYQELLDEWIKAADVQTWPKRLG